MDVANPIYLIWYMLKIYFILSCMVNIVVYHKNSVMLSRNDRKSTKRNNGKKLSEYYAWKRNLSILFFFLWFFVFEWVVKIVIVYFDLLHPVSKVDINVLSDFVIYIYWWVFVLITIAWGIYIYKKNTTQDNKTDFNIDNESIQKSVFVNQRRTMLLSKFILAALV